MGACAVLANVGSDEINAKVYGSLSSASRLILNIKTKGQVLVFSAQLWQLNGRVENLLKQLTAISEGHLPKPSGPPAEMTPANSERAISTLEELGRMLSYIYEQSRRRGFTNNSLLAGSLSRMKKHSECLFDFADYLHVLIQHENVSEVFQRADGEKARGELFSIS